MSRLLLKIFVRTGNFLIFSLWSAGKRTSKTVLIPVREILHPASIVLISRTKEIRSSIQNTLPRIQQFELWSKDGEHTNRTTLPESCTLLGCMPWVSRMRSPALKGVTASDADDDSERIEEAVGGRARGSGALESSRPVKFSRSCAGQPDRLGAAATSHEDWRRVLRSTYNRTQKAFSTVANVICFACTPTPAADNAAAKKKRGRFAASFSKLHLRMGSHTKILTACLHTTFAKSAPSTIESLSIQTEPKPTYKNSTPEQGNEGATAKRDAPGVATPQCSASSTASTRHQGVGMLVTPPRLGPRGVRDFIR